MRGATLLLLALLLIPLSYAMPTENITITIINNTDIIDMFSITTPLNETFNNTKNYTDTAIIITKQLQNMQEYECINKSQYYYTKKPEYYLKANNITRTIKKKEGIIFLNISTNYPTSLTIEKSKCTSKLSLNNISGNLSIPLYYSLQNKSCSSELIINSTYPIKKQIKAKINLKINDTMKPKIFTIIAPQSTKAGDEITIATTIYENIKLKQVKLIDEQENKSITLLCYNNLCQARYTPHNHGKHTIKIQATDIFNNTATKTKTIQVNPRETILVQDVILSTLKKDYEYIKKLFQTQEEITIKYRLIQEEWNSSSNQTEKPILLLRIDKDDYKPITSSWKTARGRLFELSITAYSKGKYKAIIEFSFPPEYKSEKNTSLIKFLVANQTIEQNISFTYGSLNILCSLSKNTDEYICQTRIPADKSINEQGIFLSKHEIDNMREYYEAKIENEQTKRKLAITLFTALLLTNIIILIIIITRLLLQRTRLRWW